MGLMAVDSLPIHRWNQSHAQVKYTTLQLDYGRRLSVNIMRTADLSSYEIGRSFDRAVTPSLHLYNAPHIELTERHGHGTVNVRLSCLQFIKNHWRNDDISRSTLHWAAQPAAKDCISVKPTHFWMSMIFHRLSIVEHISWKIFRQSSVENVENARAVSRELTSWLFPIHRTWKWLERGFDRVAHSVH